jgi:hypothetical protein
LIGCLCPVECVVDLPAIYLPDMNHFAYDRSGSGALYCLDAFTNTSVMSYVNCVTTPQSILDTRGCAALCLFGAKSSCIAYQFNNQSCRICQAGSLTEFNLMKRTTSNCTIRQVEQLFSGLTSVAFAVSLSCTGIILQRSLTDEYGAAVTCNAPLQRIPTVINIIGPPLQSFYPPKIVNSRGKSENTALTGFVAFIMSISMIPIVFNYLDLLFNFDLFPFCITCLRKLKFQ